MSGTAISVLLMPGAHSMLLPDSMMSLRAQSARIESVILLGDERQQAALESAIDRYWPTRPHLHHVTGDGFGQQVEKALLGITAKFVALISTDAILPPDGLARLLAAARDSDGAIGNEIILGEAVSPREPTPETGALTTSTAGWLFTVEAVRARGRGLKDPLDLLIGHQSGDIAVTSDVVSIRRSRSLADLDGVNAVQRFSRFWEALGSRSRMLSARNITLERPSGLSAKEDLSIVATYASDLLVDLSPSEAESLASTLRERVIRATQDVADSGAGPSVVNEAVHYAQQALAKLPGKGFAPPADQAVARLIEAGNTGVLSRLSEIRTVLIPEVIEARRGLFGHVTVRVSVVESRELLGTCRIRSLRLVGPGGTGPELLPQDLSNDAARFVFRRRDFGRHGPHFLRAELLHDSGFAWTADLRSSHAAKIGGSPWSRLALPSAGDKTARYQLFVRQSVVRRLTRRIRSMVALRLGR